MICKCYPPTPRFHVWPITRPRTAAICEYGVLHPRLKSSELDSTRASWTLPGQPMTTSRNKYFESTSACITICDITKCDKRFEISSIFGRWKSPQNVGTSGYFSACTIFRTSFFWREVHVRTISTYIPKVLEYS